jgi:hypothetical protein
MKQRSSRAALLAVAVALASIGGGCTGSDVLVADRGQISLQIQMSSTPAPTYAFATFTVNQIEFRATDPGSSQSQSDPLALLSTALTVDLNAASTTTASTVTVTSQAYVIEPFTLSEFQLNVDPVAPGSSACSGSTVISLRPSESVTIDPPCTFTVPRTGSVTIPVTIDGAGLATFLASRIDCSDPSTFNPPTSAELLAYVSFQCGP